MLVVERQLIDRFADDLLQSREETLLQNDLRILRPIYQVCLDKQVANRVHRH